MSLASVEERMTVSDTLREARKLVERDWTTSFHDDGTFEACRAAERFLVNRGFSIGRMQGPAPRGILHGDYDIQKWRNLSPGERRALHGTMTGSMRNGPVFVRIFAGAPEEARRAIALARKEEQT